MKHNGFLLANFSDQIEKYAQVKSIGMEFWIWFISITTLCCLFCWYISPDRKGTPSKLQRFLALTWIVIRRIAGFSGAALGVYAIYYIWGTEEDLYEKLTTSLMALALSIFFVYVGIVGRGSTHFGSADDLSHYDKVKEKYRIRW
ncbi:membrane hypothetical protein [Vibrio nigripulchritudo SFn118]|nr:membrane hypothetical protein [Vibrio nigripulchritudo SFn118]